MKKICRILGFLSTLFMVVFASQSAFAATCSKPYAPQNILRQDICMPGIVYDCGAGFAADAERGCYECPAGYYCPGGAYRFSAADLNKVGSFVPGALDFDAPVIGAYACPYGTTSVDRVASLLDCSQNLTKSTYLTDDCLSLPLNTWMNCSNAPANSSLILKECRADGYGNRGVAIKNGNEFGECIVCEKGYYFDANNNSCVPLIGPEQPFYKDNQVNWSDEAQVVDLCPQIVALDRETTYPTGYEVWWKHLNYPSVLHDSKYKCGIFFGKDGVEIDMAGYMVRKVPLRELNMLTLTLENQNKADVILTEIEIYGLKRDGTTGRFSTADLLYYAANPEFIYNNRVLFDENADPAGTNNSKIYPAGTTLNFEFKQPIRRIDKIVLHYSNTMAAVNLNASDVTIYVKGGSYNGVVYAANKKISYGALYGAARAYDLTAVRQIVPVPAGMYQPEREFLYMVDSDGVLFSDERMRSHTDNRQILNRDSLIAESIILNPLPVYTDYGKYTSSTGNIAQQSCAAGTYSNKFGAASCTSCDATSIAPNTGATSCETCDTGTHANNARTMCIQNTYTVTYDANGGSGDITDTTCKYGSDCVLKANEFSLDGYNANGWNTAADGSGTHYDDASTVLNLVATNGGNFVLYAQYTGKQYTVKYAGNGSDSYGVPSAQTMTYGTLGYLTTGTPIRPGYTFVGWNTKTNGTGTSYTPGQTVKNLTTDTEITLYAVWNANKYTVNFNPNGGSGTMDPKGYTYGTQDELPANEFTRDGYAFAGWRRTANDVLFSDKEMVSNLTTDDSITLYAQWERIGSIELTYDAYLALCSGSNYVQGTYGTMTEPEDLNEFINYFSATNLRDDLVDFIDKIRNNDKWGTECIVCPAGYAVIESGKSCEQINSATGWKDKPYNFWTSASLVYYGAVSNLNYCAAYARADGTSTPFQGRAGTNHISYETACQTTVPAGAYIVQDGKSVWKDIKSFSLKSLGSSFYLSGIRIYMMTEAGEEIMLDPRTHNDVIGRMVLQNDPDYTNYAAPLYIDFNNSENYMYFDEGHPLEIDFLPEAIPNGYLSRIELYTIGNNRSAAVELTIGSELTVGSYKTTYTLFESDIASNEVTSISLPLVPYTIKPCAMGEYSSTEKTYYQGTETPACTLTDLGYYTDAPMATEQKPCPAGTYGATRGLTTSACSGKCSPGYYCPAHSTSATQNPCPSAETGWQISDADGLGAYSQCQMITNPTIANSPIANVCTSGTLTKSPSKSANSDWSTTPVAKDLKAAAGYFVDDTTCSPCAAGTFTDNASSATQCNVCPEHSNNTGTANQLCTCDTGYINGDTTTTTTNACVAKTYNITFDCGNGTGTAPAATTIDYGMEYQMPENSCVAPDMFEFLNWKSETGTSTYLAGANIVWNTDSDVKFVAQYKEQGDATITLKPDGGTIGTSVFSCNVRDGLVDLSEYVPIKNGYTFEYWIDINGTPYDTNEPAEARELCNGNKELTAMYSAKQYTVTLMPNDNNNSNSVFECQFGQACDKLLPDPTQYVKYSSDSVSIAGTKWCTNADGTGACYDAGTDGKDLSPNGDNVTLYVVWTAAQCVSGENVYTSKMSRPEDLGANQFQCKFICNPGYILNGDTSFTITSNKNETELTASCEPATYTVSYSCGEGTGTIESQTVTYNSEFTTAANTCQNENYEFMGWYINENKKYADANETLIYQTAANLTLTAKYVGAPVACESGKYFDGQQHQDCPQGWYCPGIGETKYNIPGCRAECPDLYSSATGAVNITDCAVSVSPGYGILVPFGSKNDIKQINKVDQTYWTQDEYVKYGQTSKLYMCPKIALPNGGENANVSFDGTTLIHETLETACVYNRPAGQYITKETFDYKNNQYFLVLTTSSNTPIKIAGVEVTLLAPDGRMYEIQGQETGKYISWKSAEVTNDSTKTVAWELGDYSQDPRIISAITIILDPNQTLNNAVLGLNISDSNATELLQFQSIVVNQTKVKDQAVTQGSKYVIPFYYYKAHNCAAGTSLGASTYVPNQENVCAACPAGSYSVAGATCQLCSNGTYTANNGDAQCLACPDAESVYEWITPQWYDEGKTAVVNSCRLKTCAAGYYLSDNTCSACPSNSSTTKGNTDSTCECTIGYTVGGTVDGNTATTTEECSMVTYSATFNCGADADTSSVVPATQNITYGQTFTLPENTCKHDGYDFLGWSDGVKLYKPDDIQTFEWNHTTNVTFTALWGKDGQFVIQLNPGEDVTLSENQFFCTQETTEDIELPTPTRVGYSFVGWYDASDMAYTHIYGGKCTESKMLTARWNPRSFDCSAGFYLPKNSEECKKCEAGFYCPNQTTYTYTGAAQGIFECSGQNEVSMTTGQIKCSSCEADQYKKDNQTCEICPKGKYCIDGVAYTCPNGGTTGIEGATQKTQCRKQTTWITENGGGTQECYYSSGDGNSAKYTSGCVNQKVTHCDAAYYQADANVQSCITVGTGYWSAADSIERVQCPEGYRNGNATSFENGCVALCAGGTHVKTAKAQCVSVAEAEYKEEHYVTYGDVSTANKCADLTPSPSILGGEYSSVSPRNAAINCRYTLKDSIELPGCNSVTVSPIAYTQAGWESFVYKVLAKSGHIVIGNYTTNASCSSCPKDSFSLGGGNNFVYSMSKSFYNIGCGIYVMCM